MRASSKRWVYIGAAAAGVLVVGGIAYAATSSSSPAKPALPPSPAPAPGGLTPASPIYHQGLVIPTPEDLVPPDWVTDVQQKLATIVEKGNFTGMTQGPLNLPIYTPQDVDGDPNNTKFVNALAVFQGLFGKSITKTTIRTDGKLDYLTAAVVCFASIQLFGYQQTFGITTAPQIAMAEEALNVQTKMPLATKVSADGTMNTGFVTALAAWQKFVGQSGGVLASMIQTGQLDFLTFSTLIIQAYAIA